MNDQKSSQSDQFTWFSTLAMVVQNKTRPTQVHTTYIACIILHTQHYYIHIGYVFIKFVNAFSFYFVEFFLEICNDFLYRNSYRGTGVYYVNVVGNFNLPEMNMSINLVKFSLYTDFF